MLGRALVGLGLVLCVALHPATAQHVLVLRDGDRYTGRLARIDSTTWTFTANAAAMRIAVDRLAAFTAPEPIGLRLAGRRRGGTVSRGARPAARLIIVQRQIARQHRSEWHPDATRSSCVPVAGRAEHCCSGGGRWRARIEGMTKP